MITKATKTAPPHINRPWLHGPSWVAIAKIPMISVADVAGEISRADDASRRGLCLHRLPALCALSGTQWGSTWAVESEAMRSINMWKHKVLNYGPAVFCEFSTCFLFENPSSIFQGICMTLRL